MFVRQQDGASGAQRGRVPQVEKILQILAGPGCESEFSSPAET